MVQTAPWLKATPASGTVVPGGAGTHVVFSLTAAATNLSPELYTSTITFNNLSDFSSQTRQFSLGVATTPVIASQPVSQEVFEAAEANFSVASGTNAFLGYQWQIDNGTFRTNLTDGTNISGANTANLTIKAATTANVGAYSVIVSNGAGTVTSSNAFLSLVPWRPVVISTHASKCAPGETVSLSVGATGNRPLTFHWQLYGTNLNRWRYARADSSTANLLIRMYQL